ncbi:hypothetical protein DY245_42880 [Streptomyces inhibens]|uniref:Integrase catalytic domain-containing protein n=1 Tax=Streptomyces inhibens TaxID=2293571 RepID=A0A371PPS0_STRIH|nr:IS3 family transposase [Streptomyces inhibens]REK84507.1 hypothetical protein DY245_42880 [Streptomyces inhibens]
MSSAPFTPKRWEIETTIKELKPQQIGAGEVLSIKTPDSIRQQIWGHLLVHYAQTCADAPGRTRGPHRPRRQAEDLITEVYEANYRVYGARKIWRHLNLQDVAVARCTVERLMRGLGITGAVRDKKVIITIPDASAERAPDLVDRDFVAPAPNRCWVADFTHVTTLASVVYVAFVVDAFSRRIVGWSAATSTETQLALDALEMALWQRDRDQYPYGKASWYITPMPGRSTHRSRSPSTSTGQASPRRSDRSATYDNALSPRSACSRPS